jgi:uncharacterized protein YndB with AHSA1/START domain
MLKKLLTGLFLLAALGTGAYYYASRASSKVRVARVFDAPIDRVWSNWNDADTMKRWWGPKDYSAPVIKNDFRVGGVFLYAMKSPAGDVHYNAGRFTDIALNKTIVSKMYFSDDQGRPVPASAAGIPGHWPDEVELRAEFTDLDGQKTKVEITETGIPLIMSVFARMGWEQQFDKFAQVVQ